MVGQCHRSYQHEFNPTPGGSGRQEGLACSGPWSHKEWDTTKRLDNNNNSVLSSFLRSILGMPRCVPAAALRLETGLTSLECSAWLFAFRYWNKVIPADPSMGYLNLLQKGVHNSSWLKAFPVKLHLLGLSLDFLYAQEPKAANSILEKRIRDIDFQYSTAMARKTCSILHLGLNYNFSQSARYLENLIIPKYRHVFSRAWFNFHQSTILAGHSEASVNSGLPECSLLFFKLLPPTYP